MNSQELRALQEAYSQVYELDEGEKPLPYGRMMKKSDELASTDDKTKQKRAAKIYTAANAPKGPKIKVKEQTDLYDIILSHLLDEGYAETQEQAEVIMVNMSEEWRESICENVSSGKSRVTRYVQSKPTGPVTNRELDVSRQKRMDAENDRIKKIGDEAHAAATSKGLSFAEAEFRRKRAELRARKNS